MKYIDVVFFADCPDTNDMLFSHLQDENGNEIEDEDWRVLRGENQRDKHVLRIMLKGDGK